MSYIKRLKLQGFKSFANPTVLSFEEGFNTIVGANGSGKSNVFDAMCFVLGRLSSRELRTEKLGNLVFNGGKNLKPAKEAEVSIYLNNAKRELLDIELDEIKVTRVVNKKGQSKYLLNNNKVTRTEIVEVLRKASINPDGYNVVLQGDIVKIVNMTPVERRELIEEISNISGYEEKREKGLKKLEKVEQDLKDADLLMEEKTKYLKELKSEKEAAERYHKVKEDLRYSNLLLIKARILRNDSLIAQKKDDLVKTEEGLGEYKEKLEEFDKQTSDIENEISSIEKEIEIQSHNDFISVTNRITSLEAELEKLKERKAEYKKQSEEVKTRNQGIKKGQQENKEKIKVLEGEIKELQQENNELEKQIKEVDNALAKLKKNASPESLAKLSELDQELEELYTKRSDKNLIRQDNAIQIEKLNTKLEHFEQELSRISALNAENKDDAKKLDSDRSQLKKLIMSISEKNNKLSENNAKLHAIDKEYSSLLEEHSRARMKLDAGKDLMATNRAVDMMLKLKQKDPAILGTVADLASVPEKYALALETAAGKSLFNIVVRDDKTAVKYINYLRENKVGTVTFLPLNKINAHARLSNDVLAKKGTVDFALNLIQYNPEYQSIFNLVFGDLLVIDNIESAKSIGIGSYKMVSLDGDYVAKSGAMSGGFRSKKRGLGAFKDDKLMEKVAAQEAKLGAVKASLDQLKDNKDTIERELYDLRSKKIEVESDVAKLEKVLSVEGRDSSSINKEVEALHSDRAVIESSLKKIDRDIADINQKIEKVQAKKHDLKGTSPDMSKSQDALTTAEEKRDKLRDEKLTLSSSISTKEIQIKNVLKPEISNLGKILKENDESLVNLSTLLADTTEKIKQVEEEHKEFKAKEKELSKGYKELLSRRDKLKGDKLKLEQKYEKEFAKFDKIKEKAAQIRYAISEYESLQNTLLDDLSTFTEQLKAEFSEFDESTVESKVKELTGLVESDLEKKSIDIKELQSRVNTLKTKISSFGAINMKAVAIYDKINEEFNILLEKRQTLNEERDEILHFIAEIDEKKKERFMETFATLKKNFIEIFAKLSTKGTVELNIENEKDLFNSGVEIKVKLSEKNYLDIKSLSGGEKTITAVAFIFAVQEFNPASFYILDEIDAALDIMNSEKLGKLIREYSAKAQYIVVSHSEYFIQSSEIIYGVTMNANKVSTVVSLDLRNMKEYLDDEVKPVTS